MGLGKRLKIVKLAGEKVENVLFKEKDLRMCDVRGFHDEMLLC